MLDVAGEKGEAGDLLLHDMGQGLPFRHGVFDGAIRSLVLASAFSFHGYYHDAICHYVTASQLCNGSFIHTRNAMYQGSRSPYVAHSEVHSV